MSAGRPWAALAVLGSAVLLPPETLAQACDGYAPLKDRHFLVAASFASYSYAKSLAGSFTAGKVLYATAGGGSTHDPELDASTTDIRAVVGAVRQAGAEVCDALVVIEKGRNRPAVERELGIRIKSLVSVEITDGKVVVK